MKVFKDDVGTQVVMELTCHFAFHDIREKSVGDITLLAENEYLPYDLAPGVRDVGNDYETNNNEIKEYIFYIVLKNTWKDMNKGSPFTIMRKPFELYYRLLQFDINQWLKGPRESYSSDEDEMTDSDLEWGDEIAGMPKSISAREPLKRNKLLDKRYDNYQKRVSELNKMGLDYDKNDLNRYFFDFLTLDFAEETVYKRDEPTKVTISILVDVADYRELARLIIQRIQTLKYTPLNRKKLKLQETTSQFSRKDFKVVDHKLPASSYSDESDSDGENEEDSKVDSNIDSKTNKFHSPITTPMATPVQTLRF